MLTSFHLQGEALQWYQWYAQTRRDIHWEEFTTALCIRFGLFDYENFDEALAKLRQTGMVREYHNHFECLTAMVHN